MRRVIIVAGLFFVLGGLPLALADTYYDTSVQQLQWLDSTSPYQSFIHDRDSGLLRFYAVNGYAKEIVGVGLLNFERCYGEVELTTIEGTSDDILSKEHGRLIGLAYDFAFKYNNLMKNYIDSIGERNCGPQADWDAMFAVVTDKV